MGHGHVFVSLEGSLASRNAVNHEEASLEKRQDDVGNLSNPYTINLSRRLRSKRERKVTTRSFPQLDDMGTSEDRGTRAARNSKANRHDAPQARSRSRPKSTEENHLGQIV